MSQGPRHQRQAVTDAIGAEVDAVVSVIEQLLAMDIEVILASMGTRSASDEFAASIDLAAEQVEMKVAERVLAIRARGRIPSEILGLRVKTQEDRSRSTRSKARALVRSVSQLGRD